MNNMNRFSALRSWSITATAFLFVVGSALGMSSFFWLQQQTEQSAWYTAGRIAYVIGDDDTAVRDFDRSIAAYQSAVVAQHPGVTAAPSLEQAQLALFHKANALLKLGNGELAVTTFKDALKLVTDANLEQSGLLAQEVATIRKERVDTETDLEILFHQQPQLAKGEGQGKGKPQDGDKKSEDPSQGDQAGKDPRDSL